MKSIRKVSSSSYGQAMFPIILLLLLFVSAAGVAGYFYYAREQTMTYFTEKVDALNKKYVAASEVIKKREIENKELRNVVANYKTQVESLQQKRDQQQVIIDQMTKLQTVMEQEFTSITASLSDAFSKVDDFSLLLDSKLGDYLKENRKEIVDIIKESRKKALKQLSESEGVQLPEVVVTPEGARDGATAQPAGEKPRSLAVSTDEVKQPDFVPRAPTEKKKAGVDIKVMRVNQKHRFLIINKGMIDGVKVGTPIEVYRKDIKIADAQVTEVRELLSLALIDHQYDGHFVEEGDAVRFL